MNPHDVMIKTARLFPDKEILVSPEKRLTAKELLDRSIRISNALLDLGLKKEDKVAVLLTNSYQSVECFCGLDGAGMARVPLNMRNSAREHLYILDNSEGQGRIRGGRIHRDYRIYIAGGQIDYPYHLRDRNTSAGHAPYEKPHCQGLSQRSLCGDE